MKASFSAQSTFFLLLICFSKDEIPGAVATTLCSQGNKPKIKPKSQGLKSRKKEPSSSCCHGASYLGTSKTWLEDVSFYHDQLAETQMRLYTWESIIYAIA